jgi:hypothetical protein
MRRRLGAGIGTAAIAAVVLFAIVGHATIIGTASTTVGAGRASVARCDTDGITVTQVLTGNNVTVVAVAGIASACGTGSLSATVNNGTTSSTGVATVPAGGGSMTVILASAVGMKDSDEIDVAITGP